MNDPTSGLLPLSCVNSLLWPWKRWRSLGRLSFLEDPEVPFGTGQRAAGATGLEQLIAANGGMGTMQKNLRADGQPLFQSLSQLADGRWLKSACTLAGVPTPGVAATIGGSRLAKLARWGGAQTLLFSCCGGVRRCR